MVGAGGDENLPLGVQPDAETAAVIVRQRRPQFGQALVGTVPVERRIGQPVGQRRKALRRRHHVGDALAQIDERLPRPAVLPGDRVDVHNGRRVRGLNPFGDPHEVRASG